MKLSEYLHTNKALCIKIPLRNLGILRIYSWTPLIRTRLIRIPRYFELKPISLGFALVFSVIYYRLIRTRLIRIPRYFEQIVFPLALNQPH